MSTCVYSDFLKVTSVTGNTIKLEDGSFHSLNNLQSFCDRMGYVIKESENITNFDFLYGQSIRMRLINSEVHDIQLKNVVNKVKK